MSENVVGYASCLLMLLQSSNSGMWPAERRVEAAGSAGNNDDTSDHACISEEVKRNLLCVLRTQRHGTNVDSLDRCYRDKFGSKLDFKKHGFDSVLDMLKTVKELR